MKGARGAGGAGVALHAGRCARAPVSAAREVEDLFGVSGASSRGKRTAAGHSNDASVADGAEGVGITLSPVQAARAGALADAQGLGDKVQFQVADALNMPFADDSFDLVWSLESGEHMPDKEKFVAELSRVRRDSAQFGAFRRNFAQFSDPSSQPLRCSSPAAG